MANRQAIGTLHFGRCELRCDARELLLDGELRHVEPRVFDLLAYLVQHHERAVTRSELLAHVWPTEHVSETVVAHSIMKARRAIGDDQKGTRQIKTLHRTGYRFVGAVGRTEAKAPVREARRKAATSIAVLPFQNRSGDTALVWVELGLPALVNRTLEAQPGLSVLPLLDVAAAVREAAVQGATATSAGVQRRLGADAVLAFEVLADGDQPYLSWTVHRSGGPARTGTVGGQALTDLAIQCAQGLARELAAAEAPPRVWPFDGETFLAEAFARGMQAVAEQRFQVALNYLQICVDAEPHPLEVDVEYVARLAATGHPGTPDHAAKALERAADAGDASARERILIALSVYFYYEGDHARARAATDTALGSGGTGGTPSFGMATLLLRRAELAIGDRDFELGRRLVDDTFEVARQIGAERVVAQALSRRATLEQLCGRHEPALRDLENAVALCRERGRGADLAFALIRWALVLRDVGELHKALPLLDEGVRCSVESGLPMRAAHALGAQVAMASQAGLTDTARAACARLRERRIVASPAGPALLRFAEAWMAWRVGQVDAALEHLEAVGTRLRQFPHFWITRAFSVSVGLAIEARRFSTAQGLIDELKTHPRYPSDRGLQGISLFHAGALAHAERRRDDAWRLLRKCLDVAPNGVVRAHACMSALWLTSEDRRDEPGVSSWLAEIEPWTRGQANGLAVLARHRYGQGDFAGAVEAQSQVIDGWPEDEVSPLQHTLLAAYRQALATGDPIPIEPAELLPTLRF